MYISVVIPVFNEEGSLIKLHEQLTNVLPKITERYEIIFVDDGSTDNTLKHLIGLRKHDKHIKVLAFQRNFGKSAALMAGFVKATGKLVFTMDGDLQDDPKEIPRFIEKIDKGYDMVTGWKFLRHDPKNKTIPSKIFNWLTKRVTGANVHDSNCGYKVYKNKVVKQLELYTGFHRYIPAIVHAKGFKVGEIKVTHHPRTHGVSKYGPERLVKGVLDLFTLRSIYNNKNNKKQGFNIIAIILGMVTLFSGFGIIIATWASYQMGDGYPYLTLSILLILVGIILFSLGLLSKLLLITKTNSQRYILKKI